MIATITHRHGLVVDELYPDIYEGSFISWNKDKDVEANIEDITDLQELAEVLDQPLECVFNAGNFSDFTIVID